MTRTGIKRLEESELDFDRLFTIDPGDDVSGWTEVDLSDGSVLRFGNETPNDILLEIVRKTNHWNAVLVVESFQPRGMPLYWQLVWTAVWWGRFFEAWGGRFDFLHVETTKHHLCGRTDGNVRAALIDRYGGKAKAIGNVKNPGPLYGLAKHAWPALAVAVTYAEGRRSYAPDDRPLRLRKSDPRTEPPVGEGGPAEPARDPKGRPVRRARRARP